ncbi:PIN domain protein [Gemmata obscuriglobus]|nr:PIN domain protein [Gemmata obscuriglobus]VTS02317.1 Uncharacterized protein OS=Singulisphaera acidiphila (strain ATCC BAA-1392 / DSM 18658 / VKM B-2454 / MOB10) GN=Sinac_7677 PE=4 SV=1: PIN [Gemmata obscuriglobus UQM 2246]
MPTPSVTVGTDTVLDASALLALLRSEPGAARVAAALDGAVISAVSLAEVLTNVAAYGKSHAVTSAILRLRLPVIPFDEVQAGHVADLPQPPHAARLSLGDRACLALGLVYGVPVLTTNQAWGAFNTGVRVEIIR